MKSIFTLGLIIFALEGVTQSFTISGKVTDEFGEGLPGATVRVDGTSTGTITDYEGNYTLSSGGKSGTLVFSFVGYLNQQVSISEQSVINVSLRPDVEQLDEVVVVGYGSQKKDDLTGATGVLTSKDIDLQPVQRVQNMLQGKVAGVMVSQNSGAPGAAAKVNIRGFTGNPVYVINGFIDADINAVNPNDIESISVLKDASATAIYGARGANGVILVTTKSGSKATKLKVNADYYHSLSQVSRRLDLLDPVSYMKVVNTKLKEGGANPIFSDEQISEAANTPGFGTNWQDLIFTTAHTDNLDLAMSKGWGKTSLRFSLGARDVSGIIDNTNYKRYTSRLDVTSQLTSKTKLKLNTSYALIKRHNINSESGSGGGSIVRSAMAWQPNVSVIDPATGDYTGSQGYGATVANNPAYLVNEKNANGTNHLVNTMVSLEQEVLTGLTFKIFGAAERRDDSGSGFNRYAPATSGSTNTGFESTSEAFKYQGDIQLNYKKDLSGGHQFDVTGVFELISRTSTQRSTSYTYPLDGSEAIVTPSLPDYQPQGMMSYLTRVGYSFQNKLLFTGSLRFDGSSRLPEGHKWGTFGSGALAYKLSEEDFLKGNKTITNLKLRVGYGEIGNVNSISAFQVQDITTRSLYAYVFEGYTRVPSTSFQDGGARANSNLQWEVSRQWNGGIDLELLGGGIEIVGDYYIKYTDRILFNQAVPDYLGGGSVKSNSGRIRNNGVELQLIHKWNSGKDFNMRSNLNLTYNQSKVVELPQDTVYVGGQIDRQTHVLVTGQKVGNLWGYKYLGPKVAGASSLPGEVANLNPGDAVYQDTNGDGQITIEDMVVLGNGNPEFMWGFNTYLEYKRFSLNLFIQGVHGVDVYNLAYNGLLGGGSGVLDATSTEILRSWSFDETGSGGLPALTAQYKLQSSIYVQDASFIRGKNATLAYDFDPGKLQKLHLGRLRVYASVQNFFTLTEYIGYDPEAHGGTNLAPGVDEGSFPQPISYTAGLNIGF